MRPLRVEARVEGPICLPDRHLALDGLLVWAEVKRLGLPQALTARECVPVEIPVARSACGRLHMASFAEFAVEEHALQWTNRRFPVAEAQQLGSPSLRRISISAGPGKSYRLPREVLYLRGGLLQWWCVGEEEMIRQLLGMIGYVGKKRAAGLGKVRSWVVEPCEPWPGFPVLRGGQPLRSLPAEWPGVVDPRLAMSVLAPPYYDHGREELCVVPWEGGQ